MIKTGLIMVTGLRPGVNSSSLRRSRELLQRSPRHLEFLTFWACRVVVWLGWGVDKRSRLGWPSTRLPRWILFVSWIDRCGGCGVSVAGL